MRGIVCICLMAVVGTALAHPGEKYDDKFDNFDTQELKTNSRLQAGYLNCLYDEGPCTAEGKELRSKLGDALSDGCAKCTAVQKEKAEDIIKYLYHEKNEDWEKLKKKYDPTGEYSKKYEEEFKKRIE